MTRPAIIVAHGQPSDPRTAGAALEALATRVQVLLPGWAVGAATLALQLPVLGLTISLRHPAAVQAVVVAMHPAASRSTPARSS